MLICIFQAPEQPTATLISPFPPSFLDKYILVMSHLGFSAWCIVISYFVLLSMCSNSVPAQSRKAAEYLSNEIAYVFIHVIMFPPFNFVSSIFHVFSYHLPVLFPNICDCNPLSVLSLFYLLTVFHHSLPSFLSSLSLLNIFPLKIPSLCHY